MSTTSAEEALLATHRKAAEVRSLCAVYDLILLDIRREYQFPVETEKWAAGLAERLELLNKDYRRTVRSNSHNLETRLRSLYGRRAAASQNKAAIVPAQSTTQGLSLILVSKPSPVEARVDEQEADLMCDLLVRVEDALQLCTRIERLVPQMAHLYEAHDGVMPLLQRVRLRRDLARFQRGLDEASTYKKQIQRTMEEWRPYFVVLADKAALERLLTEVHAQKLSAKAFLSEVTPMVDRFRALRDKRDDIMNKVTALSFAHEANWLPLGSSQILHSLVAKELGRYDDLLDAAKQQRAPHDEILECLKDFKDRAISPQVVVGPGGVDIELSSLPLAYIQFREVHFACNGVMRVAKPLLGALEGDIEALRTYELGDAAVTTQ